MEQNQLNVSKMNGGSDDSLCTKMLVKLKDKINYFCDESNLHGVGKVFSMSSISFFKRLFWLIILICCCLGASAILRGSLNLYFGDNMVSYSVETNYLNWDTPFPAVTVCEQLDEKRIKNYLTKKNLPMSLQIFFKENSFWNLKYCRACTSCQMNQTCVEDFQDNIKEIRLNCTDLLTECWWGGKNYSCCDIFYPVMSEYGTCFAFNSRLAINESDLKTVNRAVGLPYLTFTTTQTIQLRVHPPDDVVTVMMENLLGYKSSSLPLYTDFEALLKAEQTISDSSVSQLSAQRRGCLFAHERPPRAQYWPFKEYTYNACLMYCKILAQIEFCNCTHHFMPRLGEWPVCNTSGLGCFYVNKDRLRDLKCECPMGCEEIMYKIVHISNFRHLSVNEDIVKRGTRAKIRMVSLPALRVRRHAIRDTLGLVVDIGGVGGVFFGASLLSVIEIIYIFFIRQGP